LSDDGGVSVVAGSLDTEGTATGAGSAGAGVGAAEPPLEPLDPLPPGPQPTIQKQSAAIAVNENHRIV
jgi:hypothetical protein